MGEEGEMPTAIPTEPHTDGLRVLFLITIIIIIVIIIIVISIILLIFIMTIIIVRIILILIIHILIIIMWLPPQPSRSHSRQPSQADSQEQLS
jgi:hypothetical protein